MFSSILKHWKTYPCASFFGEFLNLVKDIAPMYENNYIIIKGKYIFG